MESHPLILTVDRGAAEPVYGQIARQIRGFVVAGRLATGATLPPVRALASDLGVNLNTVARAYRLLEDEGFVRIRVRTGAVVVSPAERADVGAKRRLIQELGQLLARMRQSGVPISELRRLARLELDALEDVDDNRR